MSSAGLIEHDFAARAALQGRPRGEVIVKTGVGVGSGGSDAIGAAMLAEWRPLR
ncbi:hypothetical protein [Paucibacter sp. PLA-PC-4]|uniref:hypothetical protein n=1 Tax=Paucibacter sp. PLA-PC-4 TaxID=2993655 RepID=UPI00224AA310|nr:hypothetical protein [Paucibacter sp. PLA-PC-4]